MSLRIIKLVFLLMLCSTGFAQTTPEKWDIVRLVDYALTNNISVRQNDLQARFSELDLKQQRAGRWPTLNFSTSSGYRLGRSENPTTGVYEDNNFFNTGVQLQSQVDLFNWFSRKHSIEASRLTWEADKQQIDKAKNDVALNVAIAYLQILLANEQANLARLQIEQTRTQLDNTRKRVDAGTLPELNAVEFEAQLARDSSSLVTAEAAVQGYKLQMKALLNLDAAVPFDVVIPSVGIIPVESLADLQPDAVYASAIANLPQQKVNDLRIEAAKKTVAAAKAMMYPTISAFGSLASNAVQFKRNIYDQVVTGFAPTGFRANAGGGTFYPIEAPIVIDGTNVVGSFKPDPMFDQFKNNFGQSIGIGISVPIFNGRVARTGWERSKLQVRQRELTKELDNMTLKQDIYTAYNDAMAALQKFNANKKAVEFSQRAYDYAQKRYDVALLSTLELVTSQNNLLRARIDMLYAQYDYVFKIKLLEFYKGQGLKL